MLKQLNALWAYFYIDFSFFKAAKTGVADVVCISVRVIAQDVMLHTCLGTARNPAIGVNLLLVLDQEVS